ncbi:hypothetical protein CEP51_016909, partial [Fusarium floridanum]
LIKRAPSSRAPHGGDTSTSQTQSYNTEDDSSAETSNDYTDSEGESYGSYDEDDEEDIGPSDSASTSDHEGHYARPQRLPPQQRQHQLPPAGQYGQQYPPQHPYSTQHQFPPQHQLPPQQHQLPPHQPPRHQLTPHQALQPHQPPPPTEYGPEYGLEEEPQPQPQSYRRPSRRERPPKTATLDDPRYPAYGRGGFPHPTAPGRPGPGQFFGRGQTGFQNHVGPYMGYPANSQMVPFGYDPNNPYDPYGGEGRGMYDMMPYQGQQQQQPPG